MNEIVFDIVSSVTGARGIGNVLTFARREGKMSPGDLPGG